MPKKKKKVGATKVVATVDRAEDYSLDIVSNDMKTMMQYPKQSPINANILTEWNDELLTYTVVCETATWKERGSNKTGSYKMEAGRKAAQVGHAVSKLKLTYLMQHMTEMPIEQIAAQMCCFPITSIVLQARDSEELEHIFRLALMKELPAVSFTDDNDAIYGKFNNPMTAVSIGPIFKHETKDIIDYLPLWKDPSDPVR